MSKEDKRMLVNIEVLDREGKPELIEYDGVRYQRLYKNDLVIRMVGYPQLSVSKDRMREAVPQVKAMIKLLEASYSYGWDKNLKEFHPDLNFLTFLTALCEALFNPELINPELYPIMKKGVHPLVLMQTGEFPNLEGKITEEKVASAIAEFLKYMRFVKMDDLYEAINTNNLAVYKGMGLPQMLNLPVYPALKYQQERSGDLTVGKMIPKTPYLYGGSIEKHRATPDEQTGEIAVSCPACNSEVHLKDQYLVCPTCSLGLIVVE